MRILLTAHNLVPASFAGVEIHTHQIASALHERGHEVTVAVPRNAPVASAAPPYRLRFIEGATNWMGADVAPARHRKVLWERFRAIVDEVNPDVIHVQHLLHMGWQWLEDLPRIGRPFILSLLDYWTLCPAATRTCGGSVLRCAEQCCAGSWNRPPGMIRRILRVQRRQHAVLRLLNALPAPLVPCSAQAADIFAGAGVRSDRLVPMRLGSSFEGVSPDSLSKTPPLRYVFIGTVAPHKGIKTLLRAWQRHDDSNGDTLAIHGTGDAHFLIALQRMARGGSARFFGAYSHERLPEILSQADVVIVPPEWEEAYGLTVQEALLAGRMVIASETGGIAGRIVHGLNGLLFPPGDVEALAARLKEAASIWDAFSRRPRNAFGICHIAENAANLEDLYRWTIAEWKGLCEGAKAPVEWTLRKDARLLAQVTGDSEAAEESKLVREYRESGSTVRDAWNIAKPEGDEAITSFYRETDSYMYDLLVVQHSTERRVWREEVLNLLVKYGASSLLDYGGGCGTDAILFTSAGLKVTLFDVGKQNLRLARLRAENAGVSLETTSTFPADGLFDAVHCTEVLEHVPDPMEVMRKIISVLAPGGVALVTHSFDLIDKNYPSHLPQHAGLSSSFVALTQDLGAEYVESVEVPGNRYLVFRRALNGHRTAAREPAIEKRRQRTAVAADAS